MEQQNRGDKKPPHKKNFNFKTCKKNTIKSLNEIEYFLNNFKRFTRYVKIYRIFLSNFFYFILFFSNFFIYYYFSIFSFVLVHNILLFYPNYIL